MNEIEQLQLQHRCEQLELIVSHLSLIHAYAICKLSGYQQRSKIFKQIEEEQSKKDSSDSGKINLLLTFLEMTNECLISPIHFLCHAYDEYLYALNEPYKTIASKLFQSITNENDHKDLITKISGYKPQKCCSINKEGDEDESISDPTTNTI